MTEDDSSGDSRIALIIIIIVVVIIILVGLGVLIWWLLKNRDDKNSCNIDEIKLPDELWATYQDGSLTPNPFTVVKSKLYAKKISTEESDCNATGTTPILFPAYCSFPSVDDPTENVEFMLITQINNPYEIFPEGTVGTYKNSNGETIDLYQNCGIDESSAYYGTAVAKWF